MAGRLDWPTREVAAPPAPSVLWGPLAPARRSALCLEAGLWRKLVPAPAAGGAGRGAAKGQCRDDAPQRFPSDCVGLGAWRAEFRMGLPDHLLTAECGGGGAASGSHVSLGFRAWLRVGPPRLLALLLLLLLARVGGAIGEGSCLSRQQWQLLALGRYCQCWGAAFLSFLKTCTLK